MSMTTEQTASSRSMRAVRSGVVASAVRDKTIAVTVQYQVKHGKYGKFMLRETTLHAHDEANECRKGDRVEVAECRPYSKTKHWRLVKVLEKAPEQPGGAR